MGAILIGGVTAGAWLDSFFAVFDYSVFQMFGSVQNGFFTFLAKVFTSMGEVIYGVLFCILCIALIFFKRTRRLGLALVFAIVIGTLLTNFIIKPAVLRVRPYNTLQNDPLYWSWYLKAGALSESDYCFPSGHTTIATEISIVLCYIHAGSKRGKAKGVCWIFPLIAVLVGFSRVYLMVHYMSDVLAGWVIGIIAGFVGILLMKLACRVLNRPFDFLDVHIKRTGTAGAWFIALAWMVIFVVSFMKVSTSGGEDALRCAYNGTYDCQNEVKEKPKYEFNGEYYCKIHINELTSAD